MRERRYHAPRRRAHAEIEAVFATDNESAVCDALVAAALNDDDRLWIEAWCATLAENPSVNVRGVAVTCLGHVARRFGTLQTESVQLLRQLRADPDVTGRVEDALDDVAQFTSLSL